MRWPAVLRKRRDAPDGPSRGVRALSDPGRWARLGPFAAIAGLSLALAGSSPEVSPGPLAAATLLALGIAAAAVLLPWRRWPADLEAAPAVAYLLVGAILGHSGGLGSTGVIAMGSVSVLWLALFHRATLLAIGLVGLVAAAVVPELVTGRGAGTATDAVRAVLLLCGCAAAAVAVHLGVRRSRMDTRRTERLLADVLAAANGQSIIGTDPAGAVTVFSAGAERLLGYRAAEVVGAATLAAPHLPAELAARAAELDVPVGPQVLVSAARGGDPETREWTYVSKDGTTVRVALTVTAMRDELDEVTGYLGVARDLTGEQRAVEVVAQAHERERDAAARLGELERVRADLVGTVSHELRTPLTSILGNVEMLSDGDAGALTPPQARLLATVDRNARRLLVLVDDLLMLSRVESGAVRINARSVPVRAVVAGALEALEPVRARRGVTVALEVGPEDLMVYGDRDQLERVVVNLVDNALKFTEPGGSARIRVDDLGGQIRLTVADTGIGIPVEEIDSIFDRFFRSSLSQQRVSPGSGLGLAITKSIVERHGGRIWARSRPTGGTEVVCLLPSPPATVAHPGVGAAQA